MPKLNKNVRETKTNNIEPKANTGIKNHIEINYNPYIYELKILNISNDFGKESQIKAIIDTNKEKSFHLWYRDFFEAMYKDFNSKKIEVVFNGREEEAFDFKEVAESLNNNGWDLDIKLNIAKQNKNIVADLEKYIKDISEEAPEELKKILIEKKALEEFENAKNNEAEISVIATMSSGKSTLLNAMLGDELLPSKNEACTATICRITDNKGLKNFKMRAETLSGEEILKEQEATVESLITLNDKGNNEGINIYLEGDIKGITSKDMRLVLIDTPGPNNSQNMEHKEATYKFIKDTKNNPLVLYVMNATQNATTDDARLLREISEIIKENGKQAEERFIFALNKIDSFDPDKESIESLINNSKRYLSEFGIKNPKIFPLSANAAKLVRLKENGKELSRKQRQDLTNYEMTFLPEPEDNYMGIDTIKYASIPENIKEKLYREAKRDNVTALLHYSGISAIEYYIDSYVNKYAKIQKIKDSIGTLKKVIDVSYSEIELISGKTDEELNTLRETIEMIQERLETRGKEKLNEVEKKLDELKFDDKKYEKLHLVLEDAFTKIEKNFESSKVPKDKADMIVEDTIDELKNLSLSLKTENEKIVNEEIQKRASELLQEIKKYFIDILGEIELEKDIENAILNSFELETPKVSNIIKSGLYEKKEKVGERFSHTRSTSKWWNPFSWGDTEDVYVDVYKTKKYVDMKKLDEMWLSNAKNEYRKLILESEKSLTDRIVKLREEAKKHLLKLHKNIDEKIKELNEKIKETQKLSNKKDENIRKQEIIIRYKKELDKILNG